MRLIQKPDWDPRYHYHVNGKKVVITKEDWEKYKDQPYFGEIRAEVEAEQAAHPEPEYDEVENPAWRKAYQNLVNGVNLRGRDNYLQPLPQGYTRDEKGVAMDAQGNYYLPVETATNAPYFVNQERGMYGNTVPVRYEQQQMPDRTIRQLRQPLPVDRVMNVDTERDNAINNYINSNTQYVQMYRRPYFKSEADPVIWIYGEKNALPSTSYVGGRGDAFGWHGFDIYDNDSKDAKQYSANNLITEEEFKQAVDLIPGWGTYIGVQNPNLWIDKKIARKPSRQEAEKKAIISLGDLEKERTFAKGGKLINKCQNGEKVYYNQLNTPIPKIINPKYNDFVRQADQLTYQSNLQNYRELENYLPEGYKFRNSGLIQGPNGELYAQKGYQGNLNYNNPFTITFYKGKPIQKDVQFYPINDVPEYMIEDNSKKYYKPIYQYFYGVNPNKESDNYYTAWFMTPKGKLIRRMNSGLPEQAIFSDVNNRTSQAYKDEGYFRALTEDEMRSIYNNLKNYNKGFSSQYLLQEFPTIDDYLNYGLIRKEDEKVNQ